MRKIKIFGGNIINKFNNISKNNLDDLEAELDSLNKEYAEKLKLKIQEIEKLWSTYQSANNIQSLDTLSRLVHTLAETGATFGFNSVSETARKLELYLKPILENSKTPLPKEIEQIGIFINELLINA